ncbi:unannotated protein [freshwater metagenome]|uniref:Unannotated protein n=1 Tax=freshwater metagenome TaxID=449393 RepID=A0A6J7I191_9ZZZZ
MPRLLRDLVLARSRPRTNEVRAKIPPSPLLLARITKMRYLTVMMIISAQNTNDSTPSTLSLEVASEW